jgi:transketolase
MRTIAVTSPASKLTAPGGRGSKDVEFLIVHLWSRDHRERFVRASVTLEKVMQKTSNPAELAAIAKQMRREVIEMITEAKSGHPGGSLSATEIVVTLFMDVMKHDPSNPKWKDRDRFILSKGHCCPILYAVMAECGYTPKDQLNTLRKLGSIYQGHPDVRFIPSLEASTGSLGEGLSLGLGMALAAKLDKSPSRVYVVLGDGEIQEGQVWESAMFGGFHHVDNIVAIVDHNKIQLDGFVADIMAVEPLADKWRSFGWHVIDIDGNDIGELQKAFAEAAATKNKPTCIIAETIKGKGVSFMENNPKFHGQAPTKEECALALKELA